MSQSHETKDNQALLQSMLQRLKLQPGKEAQEYSHTPVPTAAASAWGQDEERGAPNLQKVNSSPVNGCELGTNGIISKEFGISGAESNFMLRSLEIQPPGHGCEVDMGLISSHSQKDNVDADTGEERVLGKATQPAITPTGTGQLFPAESLKDADITSFERTDRTRESSGGSAMTRHISSNNDDVTSTGQNQNQDQSFTPKVYMWSLKPKDANLATQIGNEALHVGNGGFGALANHKDIQIVAANNGSIRKQLSSESKTRRWTQKIKERWRNRPGSFGNRGKKEGGTVDQKIKQGPEISPQNQLTAAENVTNTSNRVEDRTRPTLDSSDATNTLPTHTEDGTNKGCMRPTSSDFEFGLGSFSLLEEIVTGQEWARFLNPNLSAASANQRPSELKIQPNPYDSQQGGVNNQWDFKGTETSPDLDFSRAQISPEAFQPVSMDVSEERQASVRGFYSEADRSEPMEHGQTRRPPLLIEPKAILENLALKSRVHLNRKRQHHSALRDEALHMERIRDGKEADREGFISSLSPTSNHMMETGESQRIRLMPLYNLNSPPTSLFPSTPLAPAPRGVLKHSISQDSHSSMETVPKRRRVEENRRVHFSEEVFSIAAPEPESYATDSEDDSEEEEDSVAEQECEEEQAATEEVAAPARRPALPAWIQALKRRNTGRKRR